MILIRYPLDLIAGHIKFASTARVQLSDDTLCLQKINPPQSAARQLWGECWGQDPIFPETNAAK